MSRNIETVTEEIGLIDFKICHDVDCKMLNTALTNCNSELCKDCPYESIHLLESRGEFTVTSYFEDDGFNVRVNQFKGDKFVRAIIVPMIYSTKKSLIANKEAWISVAARGLFIDYPYEEGFD